MRTFQEFLDICEELTGERKERATAISGEKTRTDAAGDKKRRQARWLSGRDEFSSIGRKGHPSQKFGSAADPKKTRAPKHSIANNKRGPGVKKMKPAWTNISVDVNRPENVPGHGMPQVDTLPRGKGSKAARRAEALKNKDA